MLASMPWRRLSRSCADVRKDRDPRLLTRMGLARIDQVASFVTDHCPFRALPGAIPAAGVELVQAR